MHYLDEFKQNWKSGITVALVSIPLSISLAVASGVSPAIGIVTAIWAGLIASFFGGSNFNIVGPTGALSGLISVYAILHGVGSLAVLSIIVGCFILIAYFLRLERYLIFIPSSVIHGFTLGVALIIGFGQINYALGLYGLEKHKSFFENTIESFKHINHFSPLTLVIFLAGLVLLFILRKFFPKIPGPIIVSVLGIGLGIVASKSANFHLATLGSIFGDLSLVLVHFPKPQFDSMLLPSGAAIAIVAILETMLSAKVADAMTHTKHNERKEMMALGLANIASGIAGGIPATAALARTSLNIKMGASSKLSATISALSLILVSLLLLTYFKYIPMAAIAAILVYVAIQMIEVEHFKRFFQYQVAGFWLSLFVAFVTIYEDPIMGILFGTGASLLLVVEKLSRGHFDIKINTPEGGLIKRLSGDKLEDLDKMGDAVEKADVLLYSIKGKLVYINSKAHLSRFEDNLVKYKTIILRLRSVYYIDIDGAEALDEIVNIIEQRGQTVCFTSINDSIKAFLEDTSKSYGELKAKNLVFEKSEQALKHFGVNVV